MLFQLIYDMPVAGKQANKPALHSTVDAALEALHAHASQQQAAQL